MNEIANDNRTRCVELTEFRLSNADVADPVIVTLSTLGAIFTILVILMFLKYWDTPLIKSSSREMSIIQLSSILLLFCFPILYQTRLTPTICTLLHVLFGTLLSNVMAFVVIKTHRLLRIFQSRFTKASKFLQTKYQVTFSFAIASIQLFVVIAWYTSSSSQVVFGIDRNTKTYFHYCKETFPHTNHC